jgi:hypothetical protein
MSALPKGMGPGDYLEIIKHLRPPPTEDAYGKPVKLGARISPEWRARWVQMVVEHLNGLRPVEPEKFQSSIAYPELKPTGNHEEDAKAQERARMLFRDQRFADMRSENERRLRTTLTAEAWMREIDVTAPQVRWLMLHHEKRWGIREPVSDDSEKREEMVRLVARRALGGR